MLLRPSLRFGRLRTEGMGTMGLFGPPDIQRLKSRRDTDALLRALGHELSSIRQAAVEALGELGVLAARARLAELVQHDDSRNVRWTAAKALGALGDDEACTALQSALHDSDVFVRQYAAEALIGIDGAVAIRAVVGALEHEDTQVSGIARDGLSRMVSRPANGGVPTTTALLDALPTTRAEVRCAVAKALAAASWDVARGTPEQQLHYAAGLRRWDRWGELAGQHLGAVCDELSGGDREAFPHACRVLGDTGGTKAMEVLVEALRALPFGLSSHPADALERLGWTPTSPRDEAYWLIAKLKPGDRPARLLALGADAFDALATALPRAPEPIAVVLAALGDPRAAPLLASELDQADRAGKTCWTLVESLVRLGGAEARRALDTVSREGHLEENREAAKNALQGWPGGAE